MFLIKPLFTSFDKIIDCGDGYICLEVAFQHPDDRSNLYKIDKKGNQLWVATYKGRLQLYVDLFFTDGVLKAATGAANAILNPTTGETTSWVKDFF